MTPIRGHPAPRWGALVTQTLGTEPQASSSWPGFAPQPSGGEGAFPRMRGRRRVQPPERRETSQGARRCYQGRSASTRDKPWDTAQLLALPQTCRLPCTPAPQHGHRSQLEGHLCARRSSWRTWLLFADGCWDHWKSRLRLQHGFGPARARQHSPPQPSSQGNPQGDAPVPQHRPGTARGAEALRPLAARTGRDAARQPRARAARRPRGTPWRSRAAGAEPEHASAGMHPHTQRDPERLPTPRPSQQRCAGRRAGRNNPHPAPPAPSPAAARDPAGCEHPVQDLPAQPLVSTLGP